eukprot:TRINITY_DN2885_c0_g1_i8.p1 TRINITY_DN2885_c0_g1~~TRINITY_DN2885_c0_g1_i8.p1  ORF type:complete len:167 (-),score=17.54 TRINITY_DN2885_c0_g1_i8:89-589(-)
MNTDNVLVLNRVRVPLLRELLSLLGHYFGEEHLLLAQDPQWLELNDLLYEGTCLVGENRQSVKKNSAVVVETDEKEDLEIVAGDSGAKFLLLAGLALNEPIKQYGPFVLASQSDLEQAFEDYHNAANGFEGAHEWKSEIRKMAKRKQDQIQSKTNHLTLHKTTFQR